MISDYLIFAFKHRSEELICESWSNSESMPFLVLSTTMPRIIFLQEEIAIKSYEIKRGKRCTALKFHPHISFLVLGWEDGSITLWTEEDRSLNKSREFGKDEISCIEFNITGNRMASGDNVLYLYKLR